MKLCWRCNLYTNYDRVRTFEYRQEVKKNEHKVIYQIHGQFAMQNDGERGIEKTWG